MRVGEVYLSLLPPSFPSKVTEMQRNQTCQTAVPLECCYLVTFCYLAMISYLNIVPISCGRN